VSAINQIDQILATERREARIIGIRIGLRVAEAIARRWAENYKLEEPHSRQTLVGWDEQALKKLRAETM